MTAAAPTTTTFKLWGYVSAYIADGATRTGLITKSQQTKLTQSHQQEKQKNKTEPKSLR